MNTPVNLVIGAGITGSVLAERLASQAQEHVVVVDRKDHIAGNCYDYHDHNDICIHKYGSHIFHTNSKTVWDYVNQFASFNTYRHTVIALIDGIETTIPFNLRSLYDVFPPSMAKDLERKLLKNFQYNTKVPILEFKKQNDPSLQFLAEYIYEKVFLHYTTKQWGTAPEEIDGTVTARVPVLISCDKRYFQDVYQGIPTKGYSSMVQNILTHPHIETQLNTDFKQLTNVAKYKKIYYSGSIDEFFDYKFGQLPYRSVSFSLEEYPQKYYQSSAVVNYPCNYDFTRIHEYKHYLNDSSDKTVIAKEFSEEFVPGKNDRYYPIVNTESQSMYNLYLREAQKECPHVIFVGRLGEYKYYDMDKAIGRALEVFQSSP